MKEALTATLLADAGLSALVADRITWGQRGRGEGLPAICLFRITGRPDHVQTGPSGLADSVVQMNCYGATYTDADALAMALKQALDGLRDANFQGAFVEDEADDTSPDEGAQDPEPVFMTRLDVRVWSTLA